MSAVTKKPFAYSYSKLKTYESCALKFYETMEAKNFVEPDSTEMLWGKRVHKDMETAVVTNTIPQNFAYAEDAQRILNIIARKPNAEVLVEQQLAMTRQMQRTTWFAKDVYLRVIIDLAIIDGVVGIAVDWKTGKQVEDSPQLLLTALMMFVHFPQLQAVRTEFGWLKTHTRDQETYYRDRIMPQIMAFQPRVQKMEQAYVDTNYPAEPGRLCRKWCPVRTCIHHGT